MRLRVTRRYSSTSEMAARITSASGRGADHRRGAVSPTRTSRLSAFRRMRVARWSSSNRLASPCGSLSSCSRRVMKDELAAQQVLVAPAQVGQRLRGAAAQHRLLGRQGERRWSAPGSARRPPRGSPGWRGGAPAPAPAAWCPRPGRSAPGRPPSGSRRLARLNASSASAAQRAGDRPGRGHQAMIEDPRAHTTTRPIRIASRREASRCRPPAMARMSEPTERCAPRIPSSTVVSADHQDCGSTTKMPLTLASARDSKTCASRAAPVSSTASDTARWAGVASRPNRSSAAWRAACTAANCWYSPGAKEPAAKTPLSSARSWVVCSLTAPSADSAPTPRRRVGSAELSRPKSIALSAAMCPV